MIEIADLPAINATLNSLSAGLLTTGYVLIRRGRVTPHETTNRPRPPQRRWLPSRPLLRRNHHQHRIQCRLP